MNILQPQGKMATVWSYHRLQGIVTALVLFLKYTAAIPFCNPGEIFYCEGQCLYFSPNFMTYDEAKTYCSRQGNAKLVDTHNTYKWEFVRHHVSKGVEHWLGLEKPGGGADSTQPLEIRRQGWTWQTGSKFSNSWNGWGPQDTELQFRMPIGISACASFDQDGYWTDNARCRTQGEDKRRFVCQRVITRRIPCPSNPKDPIPDPDVTQTPQVTEVITAETVTTVPVTEDPLKERALGGRDEENIFDNYWVLVGVGLAALLVLVLVIVAAVCICRWSTKKRGEDSQDPENVTSSAQDDQRSHITGTIAPTMHISSQVRQEGSNTRRPPPPEPIPDLVLESSSPAPVISASPIGQEGGRSLRREVPLPPIADAGHTNSLRRELPLPPVAHTDYENLSADRSSSLRPQSVDSEHNEGVNTSSRKNSRKDNSKKRKSIGKKFADRFSRKSGKTAAKEFVPMPMQRPQDSVRFKPNLLPSRRAPIS